MIDTTKLAQLVKAGADDSYKGPMSNATNMTFGDALSHVKNRRGNILGEMLEHAPKAVIGGGLTMGAKALADKLMNKRPSLTQEILGRGGIAQKALMLGAVGAGIGGGAAALSGAFDKVENRVSKNRNFDAALKSNPGLKEFKTEDLQAAYDALHRFSPEIAKEPLAAGAFLRRSMLFKDEGIQPNDVKTLVDVRKALGESRKNENAQSSIMGAFSSSAKDLGSLRS